MTGRPKANRNERILQLRKQGWTQQRIAEEFGLSKQRVSQVLLKSGLKSGQFRVSCKRDLAAECDLEVIRRCAERGMTRTETAAATRYPMASMALVGGWMSGGERQRRKRQALMDKLIAKHGGNVPPLEPGLNGVPRKFSHDFAWRLRQEGYSCPVLAEFLGVHPQAVVIAMRNYEKRMANGA